MTVGAAEHKNVVIVGGEQLGKTGNKLTPASFAGHALANHLATRVPETHRVILIDRSAFALHAPAMVRAIVAPGAESRNLTAPITQDTVFRANSRHRVLAPVAVRELHRTSITLDTDFEGSTELPFDKCIIATGATQPHPLRQLAGTSLEDYRAILRHTQEELGAAKSVIIVGGGGSGVEIAGELSAHYPAKKVTLVHSRTRLLQTASQSTNKTWGFSYSPIPERLSSSLEEQLTRRGVDLALGERLVFPTGPVQDTEWDGTHTSLGPLRTVKLSSGRTIEADYVLISTGNTPNSSFVASADSGAVTDAGYIIVDHTLRVVPSSAESPLAGEYYSIGDVAATPGRKAAFTANMEANALGKLLVAHLTSGKEMGQYSPTRMSGTVICLGQPHEGNDLGAGIYSFPWIGDVAAPQWILRRMAKDYFVNQTFFARFVGKQKVGPDDG